MSGSTKKKPTLSNYWWVLLLGAILGSIITAGAFINPLEVANISWPSRWPGWTGIGQDETISEEQKVEGEKRTLTRITTQTKSGKTLWDGLNLAGTLAIPILIFYLGYLFQQRDKQLQQRDKQRADQQADLEKEIASANLRDEALQNYIDRMAEILLNARHRKNLLPHGESSDSEADNPVRDVARARTVSILRRLENDTERQARVLQFLRDAELLKFLLKKANLGGANLKKANLIRAYLREADLSRANLTRANLTRAYLHGPASVEPTSVKLT